MLYLASLQHVHLKQASAPSPHVWQPDSQFVPIPLYRTTCCLGANSRFRRSDIDKYILVCSIEATVFGYHIVSIIIVRTSAHLSFCFWNLNSPLQLSSHALRAPNPVLSLQICLFCWANTMLVLIEYLTIALPGHVTLGWEVVPLLRLGSPCFIDFDSPRCTKVPKNT